MLEQLTKAVQRNSEVTTSAVTLIQGIAKQLSESRDDPAKIEALATELQGSSDALAAAVVANTPGNPSVPPAPAPDEPTPPVL